MDAPTLNLCKQRITELSAKFDKGDGKGKVTEFAYRDQYGRYIDDEGRDSLGRMGSDYAKAGVVLGAAGAGLYARGKFPGSGRLRGPGNRFRAPAAGGFAGVADTAVLGAKNLAGDVRGLIGGARGLMAGASGAATSGKARMASILRKILSRGRA